ncbi:MAG: tRNA (cytidine(34)-2'-O)-methyltransferase [Granulosicoccaceae bacterium]
MLDIVLYQPEIPQNTGNLIRLAANTGFQLCLIHPLGFYMDDQRLQRAGLDYHEYAPVLDFDSLDDYLEQRQPPAVYPVSTKGSRFHTEHKFERGSALLFGPESRGLPDDVRARWEESVIRLPMRENSRSLNLANAVAALSYEAWRQLGFEGGE